MMRHNTWWQTKLRWLLGAWLALAAGPPALAQPVPPAPADTLAPVPEALVRHYLARSLSVQSLSAPGSTEAQRLALVRWAATAGLRLAGRLGGWWSTPASDAAAQVELDTLRHGVQRFHARQPGVVAQGCIFEIVFADVRHLSVPNRLRAEFGEDTVAVPRRRFDFAAMMYPEYFLSGSARRYHWDDRPPGEAPGVPDISRPETQLYYYYCAVRQLDAGCEALHFGQIRLIDDRDPGHRATWRLLQRVRRYARTRNRGFVLCDAHTHAEYYDPDPAAPRPDSVRQLLFDFHSYPLRPSECDTLRAGRHGAYLAYDAEHGEGGGLYGQSGGGRAPGGWLCRHLPAQAEFDNGPTGTPGQPGQWPLVWGRDEISWFAHQPDAYRSQWLIYAQARIRQLDSATYFQPPGARGFTRDGNQPDGLYWLTDTSQAETLRAIWAGETTAEAARLLLTGPPLP